jgi:hypothetical protein
MAESDQIHALATLPPEEMSGTHRTGDWEGSRASQNVWIWKSLAPAGIRTPGRQSLLWTTSQPFMKQEVSLTALTRDCTLPRAVQSNQLSFFKIKLSAGRATAQALSRWPVTRMSAFNPSTTTWDCGGQSRTSTGFSQRTSIYHMSVSLNPVSPYSIN